ncbi:MAG: glycosyltransferase family 1 protein [Archangium sp.]|nr:glycosyltransferase family 1 protein [Archangium sp.]MDP3151036.1 glycosyltransferase family 1 protein [Archangium sp.]MDP3569791.1 glycosyltransferase family 1 protein [Archangium sp.]
MSAMQTIWFDVTTIVHWHRPPVGVVRVEAECFKYLAKLGQPNIRFCHFDKRALSYHEIEASYVLDIISRYGQEQPRPPLPNTETTAKRATQRAKLVLQKLSPTVREPVIDFATKVTPTLRNALHHYRRASSAASQVATQLQQLSRPLRERADSSAAAAPPPAPFRSGDVVISAGLDWDQKDRVYLYQLKLALGLKVILFCYDLIPVLLPHLCVGEVAGMFARYFVDVAWCADEVMCISRSSQRDFLNLVHETGAPEPKTSIVRLGANLPLETGGEGVEELVQGKYLLFVSTIERRKNHEVIYRAIAQLVESGRTDLPQVVFVGMMGWGVSDFLSDLRIDPRVRGRFTVLNHVTDAQLSMLYSKALFTLYPSLYEGWGLPLAESLAHGKFCIASNSSSLPEVAGPLVDYVDPWESRRWGERIAHYLDHPEELAQKEKAIRERYRVPSWEDTGRTVFQAAQRLLNSPPASPETNDSSSAPAL